jgi:hypothetical protein
VASKRGLYWPPREIANEVATLAPAAAVAVTPFTADARRPRHHCDTAEVDDEEAHSKDLTAPARGQQVKGGASSKGAYNTSGI